MIHVKTDAELELMREAARILVAAFEAAAPLMKPGIEGDKIDKVVEDVIRGEGGIPAFLHHSNGRGAKFPASVCLSLDEEVVHGIPFGRTLREGQLAGLDIGVIYRGFYSDSAHTFGIGEISKEGQSLLDVTRESLELGIAKARAGAKVSDIGQAVQEYAESFGYGVIRELVGHGIGRNLWEDPQIPNYGPAGRGPVLRKNMVIAIEPMIALGSGDVDMIGDWDVFTKDRKPAAHFEHTIVVTNGDPEVLTRSRLH